MKRIAPGALAGLVVSAVLAAPALAGPTVTIRVEGDAATLLERTTVTLPDTDTIACSPGGAATVADALELATGGNWDRQPFANTILGETHDFNDNADYWALWNGRAGAFTYGTVGICEQVMGEGDEAVLLVDRTPPPEFASTGFATALRGVPAAVQVGTPVPVSVVVFAADGTPAPVAGATVSGGGATATTAADGTATLTFATPGVAVVKATKAGMVPTAGERVAVSAAPVAPPVPTAPDTTAPAASFSGLARGTVFSRRKAPRELAGSVTADPSGLRSVRLSIVRRLRDRCWTFDGGSERFERHRCGGSSSFRIGDRAEWSYLLPKRLPKGRYTIKAVAIDKAGNSSATETVIRVR